MKRRNSRRGQAMVEFALTLFLLLTVIFAGVEFDRMFMVYTSIANAARVAARYAIVHGGTRTGTGAAASSRVDSSAITNIVKDYAKYGFLNPDALNVTVSYPASASPTDPGNAPGSAVIITVSYPYDALTFIPVSLTLSSTTRGIIVF